MKFPWNFRRLSTAEKLERDRHKFSEKATRELIPKLVQFSYDEIAT